MMNVITVSKTPMMMMCLVLADCSPRFSSSEEFSSMNSIAASSSIAELLFVPLTGNALKKQVLLVAARSAS